MRVLLIHNILWAHYKAVVFQALQQRADADGNVVVRVLQIARNERARAALEADTNGPTYQYDYELLFDRYLEDVGLTEKIRALLGRARAFRPDVLLLTGYYDPAQLALLLWAKARGVCVIIQHESTVVDQARSGPREWLKRRIVALADGFFCFGTHAADYLRQLGVPDHKILLRKNAVDNIALRRAYERALPRRSERQHELSLPPCNFIYVGRFSPEKNLIALIDAFAQLHQPGPDADAQRSEMTRHWGLLLLGDGPLRADLQQRIDAHGLSNRVKLLAGQPWYRVPDYLALANVLVLPSLSEPWGLVVNEAMACGLPVLVSDRCGCAVDIVRNGENGLIFAPDQPNQLAERLAQFTSGSLDLPAMGAASAQRIAPWAPDRVASEMLNGFRAVC